MTCNANSLDFEINKLSDIIHFPLQINFTSKALIFQYKYLNGSKIHR